MHDVQWEILSCVKLTQTVEDTTAGDTMSLDHLHLIIFYGVYDVIILFPRPPFIAAFI